jgi:hypothetical protein
MLEEAVLGVEGLARCVAGVPFAFGRDEEEEGGVTCARAEWERENGFRSVGSGRPWPSL